MYVWSEDLASRGSQEIGSCLFAHFKKHLPSTIKHLILYSDSCGGQNRNIKLTLMLKHYLASSNIESIEQKFFLSGHSYNSCDRNFGIIEKERKLHKVISRPSDWVNIIQSAKKREPKFTVTEMDSDDFFECETLTDIIVNRKVDKNKNKISWLDTRSILYKKDQLFDIIITDDNNKRQVIDIQKRNVSKEKFTNSTLCHLYPFGREISKKKYDDLMQLIDYIPAEHRQFFRDLKYENSSEDEDLDFALASGASDSESDCDSDSESDDSL